MQKPDEHEMKQLKDDTVAYGISVRLFGGNQDKHSLTLASNLGHHQLQHHKPLCEIQVNTG